MRRKFRVYFDANIWRKINLNFGKNKKDNQAVWYLFKEREKGHLEIYCSDIHITEFKDRNIFECSDDAIEAKIKQCFDKSDKIVNRVVLQENSNGTENQIYNTKESEILKFDQLKNILFNTNKNEDMSIYSAYHLLTCFINDIDVFLTDDKNILKNNYKIKNLFNLWGMKNFIISTPEGFQRFHRHIQMMVNGAYIGISIIFGKFVLKLDSLSLFLGFGMFLNALIVIKIFQLLQNLKNEKINMKKILKGLNYIKGFSAFFYPTFAFYSAFILILSSNEIRNPIFSSIWLLLLIFVVQIPLLYSILYMMKNKFKIDQIYKIFTLGYLILGAMFGWTSAYLAHDVLLIPLLPDLTVATYGSLILFYLFLKYLEEEVIIY